MKIQMNSKFLLDDLRGSNHISNTRMICLANSTKYNSYCMAGKLINENRWIRPVSSNVTGELSQKNVTCESKGVKISPLDVVEINLQSSRPDDHQQENYIIAPNPRTKIVGRIGWEQLAEFEDKPSKLWASRYQTKCGLCDRLPDYMADGLIRNSLLLIHVSSINFIVRNDTYHKDLRVQVEFEYNGMVYRLSLTDPTLAQRFRCLGIGSHTEGDSYITISLTRPFNGYCYKVAAAVILRESD